MTSPKARRDALKCETSLDTAIDQVRTTLEIKSAFEEDEAAAKAEKDAEASDMLMEDMNGATRTAEKAAPSSDMPKIEEALTDIAKAMQFVTEAENELNDPHLSRASCQSSRTQTPRCMQRPA